MRPLAPTSDSLGGRGPRQGHLADRSAPPNPSAAPPVMCFLASESELDAAADESTPSAHSQPVGRKPSFESQSPPHPPVPREPESPPPAATSTAASSPASLSSSSSSSSLHSYLPPSADHAHTTPRHRHMRLASVLAALSAPESAVSTSSSRRGSLTTSSFDYQDSSAAGSRNQARHQNDASSPVPQLIMPSVNVPRRRPFSDAGKTVGKMRLLVAGPSGIGKTSLIQSIAQSCDHIVHMDSISPPRPDQITEIYASTRPQPWWASEINGRRHSLAKSRRSSVGEVLDRNICFVDSSVSEGSSDLASRYVESQLISLLENPVAEADLSSLLSNGAESMVDAVLYMLPHSGPSREDLDRLKTLQGMTNVIPLLARADELAGEAVSESKLRLRQVLDDEKVDFFSFSLPDATREIYAVSNATYSDHDVMDASVLMSSEYTPPLVPTELPKLIEQLFSLDGSSRLRHSAAAKCVHWRRHRGQGAGVRQTALSCRPGIKGRALSPVLTANPFAQDRSWDRIKPADWAQGLRQSLAAERSDQMARQTEARKDMPVYESSSGVVARQREKEQQFDRPSKGRTQGRAIPRSQDPLGLLELAGRIKRGGRITLEMLSSLGILGCLTALLLRPVPSCQQNLWLSKWHSVIMLD